MTCLLCATNSARTSPLPCCQLRQLAQSPRHVQAEHGKSLTQDERDALRPELAVEIARLRGIKRV
jgi:hypothetical protein